jgi:DNA repair protein RecO (recombination protein O)
VNRDRILCATVLRLRPFGEAREATFLTREEGLVRAVVYGGAKSRLRAYVSPFNSGALYLYHDPVRGTDKVTDFDCRSWRPLLREVYERITAADELARTVLAGLGGDFEAAQAALDESLDALESMDAALTPRLVAHFRWRWAGILGIRPELSSPESAELSLGGLPQGGDLPPLGLGAAKWLSLTAALSPRELHRYAMDKETAAEARRFCDAVLGAPSLGWNGV